MRILITNDDGIVAPGLAVAEDIAAELAGPDGEVWVVAPESEQSGVGHCISYTKPMRMNPLGPRRFAVDGSPADCVIAALHHVMAGDPPDLILSGVNRGHNVAEDVVYSGTVGGAMEGALHEIPSIALSQYFGPGNLDLDDPFEAARLRGAAVVRKIREMEWRGSGAYPLFYNVNFPPVPAAEVRGVVAAPQGRRTAGAFRVKEEVAPNRRTYLWLAHTMGNDRAAEGSDARAAASGHVTVTPLHADLTAGDQLEAVARSLG